MSVEQQINKTVGDDSKGEENAGVKEWGKRNGGRRMWEIGMRQCCTRRKVSNGNFVNLLFIFVSSRRRASVPPLKGPTTCK